MSKSTQDYLNLVTSEHQGQPKFVAMIAAGVAVSVQLQQMMDSMSGPLFDLDEAPKGAQLDVIGDWVGISRNLEVPIGGVFFSFDDIEADGWDSGVWKDPVNQTSVLSVLPDDVYLNLIAAKIAANQWDGTTEGAYSIWENVFPAFNILIQDNQDMSFAVGIQGGVPDAVTLALLTGGYLPLKPEGVRITEYLVPVDTNPLFGFDVENSFIAGFDVGSFAREVAPT